MGSLFKSKTPAAPTLPYSAYRDEVNGIEQVPVIGPDGSVTYITRALPLTAEQQAQKTQLDGIRKGALAEITRLSGSDYQPDEATTDSLAAWLTQQHDAVDKTYEQRAQQEETELARRGIADSTAADGVRRQRRLDEQDADTALVQQRDSLAGQIRSDQLSLQQTLYALANQGLDAEDTRQYQAAVQSQSRAAAADAQKQASLIDYYTRINTVKTQSPFSAVLRGSTPLGSLLGSWKF